MKISFKPGNSFIYSLNPLIKGLTAFCAILFFSLNSFSVQIPAFFLLGIIFIALLTRVPLREIIFSISRIWLLLLIVGLVQGFKNDGFAIVSAIEGVVRILGVFISAGIYLTVSPQSELTCFWEICFRPLALVGLPARELSLVMVIAVRFLPVITGEIDRIRMAQIARGAELNRSGILGSAASLMPLMIPTLTQAIMRANDLAMAMEARGYCLNKNRSRYYRLKTDIFDILALAAPACLVFSLVYSRFF